MRVIPASLHYAGIPLDFDTETALRDYTLRFRLGDY